MRDHGDRNRYVEGPDENDREGEGCRCTPCKQAQNTFMRKCRRLQAERGWSGEPATVDAEPIRQHVRNLMGGGASRASIATSAGVSRLAVDSLLYFYGGRPPTQRMVPATANRLLSVRLEAARTPVVAIDATGTRRRLQALAAIGWSASEQARRMGIPINNMSRLYKAALVTVATADLVHALYDELSMTPAPQSWVTDRVRRWAAAQGWLPPLAWDDDFIDLADDVLKIRLRELAEAMTDQEVNRCHTAYASDGDKSPLTLAGNSEYQRRYARRKVAS